MSRTFFEEYKDEFSGKDLAINADGTIVSTVDAGTVSANGLYLGAGFAAGFYLIAPHLFPDGAGKANLGAKIKLNNTESGI